MAAGMWRGGLGLVVVLGLASGCAEPPDDAEARLAELQAEEAKMDAALDTVETRLLGSQSMMHLWQELGRRHQEVSAIQCRVTDEHLRGMVRHLEHQEEKARELERRGHMASVEPALFTPGARESLGN